MSLLRRFNRAESGQALIETAILAPALVLLLVGTIDLGRFAEFDTKLAASARAGAQFGAQSLVNAANTTGMQTAATNEASGAGFSATATNYCECPGSTSTVTCTAGACAGSHRLLYVSVTVSGTFKPIFKYFSGENTTHSHTAVLEVGQ
jgi:Flp pilus assembly protein TadG